MKKGDRIKIARIHKLQKEHGYDELQNLIYSGQAWLMEGSVGRAAAAALKMGICMLPKERRRDYWGNIVPGRLELKPGAAGTLLNCQLFWEEKYVITFQMN